MKNEEIERLARQEEEKATYYQKKLSEKKSEIKPEQVERIKNRIETHKKNADILRSP